MSDNLHDAVKQAVHQNNLAHAILLLLDPVYELSAQPAMNERFRAQIEHLQGKVNELNVYVNGLIEHVAFEPPLPVYLVGSPSVPAKPLEEPAQSFSHAKELAADACRCGIEKLGDVTVYFEEDGVARFKVQVPQDFEYRNEPEDFKS